MKNMALLIPLILASGLLFYTGIASAQIERFSIESGRNIFNANCAGCHGEKGDGSGIKGAFNFNDNELMIRKNSSVFFEKVTNGGTAMPSFGKLPLTQKYDVAAYLWTFWMDMPGVMNGKILYQENCIRCHGSDGSGNSGAYNFTNTSVMLREKPEIFFNSITGGVQGTAMPSWKGTFSENDIWDTVKYVWTFQFRDYPYPSTPPTVSETLPSDNKKWDNTTVGISILVISLILAAFVMYLFGKGMKER